MDIYRVVCSENQRLYPGKTFVDFMPAGLNRCENSVIHDSILKMRQMINPEVTSLTSGLFLYDLGGGRTELRFERADNYQVRRYQEDIKAKYSNMIVDRFREMRAAGKEKTLDVSLSTLAIVYDFYKAGDVGDDVPKSAREMELRQKAAEYRQREQRRKELAEYQRTHEVSYPESRIMAWKMARYSGD